MEQPYFRKISALIVTLLLLSVAVKEGAEWYFVHRVLDLRGIKELSRNFINGELGRAVALGVVEFKFPNHVFIEDLKISSEGDFAAQHLILRANKIELVLRGLWKGTPSVKAIRVRNAQIYLDLEDRISGEILGYIHKINIPEILLENTTVTLVKGGKVLLEEVRGVDFSIRKDGNRINVGISDSVFPWPGLRYVNGTFSTDVGSKGMSLALDFRNARAKAIGGLYSELSPLLPRNGRISGKAFLEVEDGILKGNGKTEFSAVSGIVMQELPLKEEPWEWRNVSLDHEWARSSGKDGTYKEYHKLVNNEDSLELSREKGTKGLRNWELKLDVSDLDRIRDFLPISEQLESFGGSLRLLCKGKETGNSNDWIQLESGFTLKHFRWKDAELDLEVKEGSLNWDRNGSFRMEMIGSQFGFPARWTSRGKAGFRRAFKGDGTPYYQVQGDFDTELKTDSIVLENYLPWYKRTRQEVREEVRTRMEKLIPEIHFVRTPVYKYFLEFLTGNLKIDAKELRLKSELPNLGALALNLKFAPSQSRLEGKLSGVGEGKLSSYFTYGNDNPYFNFEFEGADLPWKLASFRFCGKDLTPEKISAKGTVRFFGNNFLDFRDHFNMNLQEVLFKGVHWSGNANFPLPLQPGFDMQFEYGDPGNPMLKNLVWKSGNFNGTGNAYGEENSDLRYSVTGFTQTTSGDSAFTISSVPFYSKFRETREICVPE